MAEHPIIFQGSMVRAILEGRKTQTRRPVTRGQSRRVAREGSGQWGVEDLVRAIEDPTNVLWVPLSDGHVVLGPKHSVGDRLWVRETWAVHPRHDHVEPRRLGGAEPLVRYKASPMTGWGSHGKWRPSIHMPRWASRLTLEVTGVRVERVQAITAADIRAEGMGCGVHDFPGGFCVGACPDLRRTFEQAWDGMYAKSPGLGWADDPWVWVYEFRKVGG